MDGSGGMLGIVRNINCRLCRRVHMVVTPGIVTRTNLSITSNVHLRVC
jgi:hypothetical protein